jgi:hypothetical protein
MATWLMINHQTYKWRICQLAMGENRPASSWQYVQTYLTNRNWDDWDATNTKVVEFFCFSYWLDMGLSENMVTPTHYLFF